MLRPGPLAVWNFPTRSRSYSSRFSAAEFFKDAPWLNVPKDRCGEILIEPLYPPGRLLGGSPLQSGKVSKLAALAAARKKKDQEKNPDATSQTSTKSVALLDTLSGESRKRLFEEAVHPDSKMSISENGSIAQLPESQNQSYPTQIKKSPSMPFQEEKATPNLQFLPTPDTGPFGLKPARVTRIAAPSMFARAMFGMSNPVQEHPSKRMKMTFTLPQVPVSYAENNPFAEPSPDDIVRNAQNSKGLT